MQDATRTPGPPAIPKTDSEPYVQQYSLTLRAGRHSRAAALPWAALGKPYRWEFGACGGHLAFTFTISSGKLPPGMRLVEQTGLLTGKPTSSGTFRFTVRTSDECNPGRSYAVACQSRPASGGIVSERLYSLVVRSRGRR